MVGMVAAMKGFNRSNTKTRDLCLSVPASVDFGLDPAPALTPP